MLTLRSRLGPYELQSLLGSGGMGEVYRARDPRLDRDVAIKVLPARFAADVDSRQRFEREAKAAAALSHPHICSIFDVGHDGDVPFIVMEYLDGESLAERLVRGLMPLQTSLEYARQIAEALSEAHRQAIVHRDLKPSNVMLVRSGVKLVDFGVAKFRPALLNEDSAASTALPDTARGTLLGTLQYMAPEQLEGLDIDSTADLFALGALVYEMVTGVAAFGADSKASIIAAILDRELPSASSFNPSVPPELDRLIVECVAKERMYRPSADLVAQRLRVIADLKHSKPTPHHLRTKAKAIRSLVVIPFATTLKSEAEDAFADGMAEGLTTSLGSFPTLRIVSQSAGRRYKGSSKRVSEIAAELRVDAVLRGEVVEHASGHLTVNAELVEAASEARLWSGQYDFERADVLNVQEQIAQSVATKIRLSGAVKEKAPRKRRLNGECHKAFLKGRFQFDNRLGNWLEASFDALSTAIAHDPTFAPAHAALSRWYIVAALRTATQQAAGRCFIDWREGCGRAEAEARLALKLDATLAEAHAALGQVVCLRWRLDEAEEAYRRSLALGPSIASTHVLYSEFLSITIRPDDAIRHCEIAKELDPFATNVYEQLACAFFAAHRFDACLATCKAGLELSPAAGLLYYFRGQAQAFSGDIDGSVQSLAIALAKMSSNPWPARAALAAALIRGGQMEAGARMLDELIAEEADPVSIAEIHIAMRRPQDALDCLELAFEHESPKLLGLGTEPVFSPLNHHPRFKRLLNGIGLSKYIG